MSEFEQVRQARPFTSRSTQPAQCGGVSAWVIKPPKTGNERAVCSCYGTAKIAPADLPEEAIIPQEVAGIRTDVIQVGFVRALEAPTDRWRPAPGGVSLGHYQSPQGRLVGWCTTGRRERLILSNNHVMANSNNARPGDPILQPGQPMAVSSDLTRLHSWIVLSPSVIPASPPPAP